MSIKSLIKSISPSWLQDGVAERYVSVYGKELDGLLDKLAQGMRAHMPTRADPSALPYIGADRLIVQGLTESAASYAARLQRAFDDWQIAGNAWSVMRQALGYVLAKAPAVRTVSSQYTSAGAFIQSVWNLYSAGASVAQPPIRFVGYNFDWDSTSPTNGSWGWWRWWFIIEAVTPNDWISPAPTWGSGHTWGDPAYSWGFSSPATVLQGLRSVLALWGAEHAWLQWIIVSFDSTLFDAAQPSGGGINPAGEFGHWSKIVNGQYVPARFANARYCDGVP